MGKIERGEHMPTLALILRIAAGLKLSAAEWAAAGFDDTLLRWQMKPEVVNGEKKDIQSRVQTRGGQTGR